MRGAARRAAADLDRAARAAAAGGADRRDVHPRGLRRHPAAGRQPARRRAPEGSAGRADPVGQHARSCCGWRGVSALLLRGAVARAGCERLGRFGFYGAFALAVTASVQLVGVYLVFSSLIIPALATRALRGPAPLRRGLWRRRARLCARAGAVGAVRPAVGRGDRLDAGRLRHVRRNDWCAPPPRDPDIGPCRFQHQGRCSQSQSRSNTAAMPCPPPMHIVTSA